MGASQTDTNWFVHDRFGMFIHWGLYALPARHEWVKQHEQIPDEVYEKYFKHFDPDLYDPELWAQAAADAGMKYFVITTKHHEGFCLWDTKLTDYKATNTPAGRDLLQPDGRGLPRQGPARRLLPLADRLAPPALHHRSTSHAMRNHPDRDEAERGARPEQATPSTCTARCASC